MHPKKKLKGAGIRMGWWWEWKSKETQRRRSGALKFSSFFFCSVFTFGGKAGEDPLQVLHMTADTSWRPRDTHPLATHTPPPPHTHTSEGCRCASVSWFMPLCILSMRMGIRTLETIYKMNLQSTMKIFLHCILLDNFREYFEFEVISLPTHTHYFYFRIDSKYFSQCRFAGVCVHTLHKWFMANSRDSFVSLSFAESATKEPRRRR